MTEEEWLVCGLPEPMLALVQHTISARKLRLFGVACCRRIWELLPGAKCELAVDIAESYADGYCEDEVLHAASQRVMAAIGTLALSSESAEYAAQAAAFVSGWTSVSQTAEAAAVACALNNTRSAWAERLESDKVAESRQQASLFREIYGNPFRPTAFDPAWRTMDVMLLANGIYAERAFDRMPILADALQDAGCDADALLSHLRDPHATHVRGCWALDLVLGKE